MDSCVLVNKNIKKSLGEIDFPKFIDTLIFADNFNQSLDKVSIKSKNIKTIMFENKFKQSLSNFKYSEFVEIIHFGCSYSSSVPIIFNLNKIYDTITLPKSVHTLHFGNRAHFNGLKFTDSIKKIIFCNDSNDPNILDNAIFPNSLEILEFGSNFNKTIEKVKFPNSLAHIICGHSFNQPLDNIIFPESLKSITFGTDFNQSLNNFKFPINLESLKFSLNFNQPITNLPSSVKYLEFDKINASLVNLPSSIKQIKIYLEIVKSILYIDKLPINCIIINGYEKEINYDCVKSVIDYGVKFI